MKEKEAKDASKYQRCDECHGGYLIVFECRDGKNAVRGVRRNLTGGKRMRKEKEIREALKKLKDEHLKKMRQPDSYSPLGLVAMIGVLEWVLDDRQRLPDYG